MTGARSLLGLTSEPPTGSGGYYFPQTSPAFVGINPGATPIFYDQNRKIAE